MDSVFFKVEFILLIIFSLVLPTAIYIFLLKVKKISQGWISLFAMLLILIAAVVLYLLQTLKQLSHHTGTPLDDQVFNSEITVALYIIPALLTGVAINLISHVLLNHLKIAEKRYQD